MTDFEPGNRFVLEELVSQIKAGNCILFLGAGVHAAPTENSKYIYPKAQRPLMANDLAQKLAEACDYQKKFPGEASLDLSRVSQAFEITFGLERKGLVDFLDDHLRNGKAPSPILRMLAALPFKIIVTTNYDDLFETALRESKPAKRPNVLVYNPAPTQPTTDISEDPTEERPMVFKMHGDLDKPESIVITDEDYITFVQRMSDKDSFHPIPQTVRFRMQRWPTLFIGYSLRDYNLRLLFRTLRWRVDPANYPPAFSVDRTPDPLILQIYQNQRRFISFFSYDLWTFVPWVYKEVHGKEFEL